MYNVIFIIAFNLKIVSCYSPFSLFFFCFRFQRQYNSDPQKRHVIGSTGFQLNMLTLLKILY